MRKNSTGTIYTSAKWILASLVLAFFMSSCSQKMAMVKNAHSQPAFVQVGGGHSSSEGTKMATTVPVAQPYTIWPHTSQNDSHTGEIPAKYAKVNRTKKTMPAAALAKVIKNIHTKTATMYLPKPVEHGAELAKYLKYAIIFALIGLFIEILSSLIAFGSLSNLLVSIGGIFVIIGVIFLVLWVLQLS